MIGLIFLAIPTGLAAGATSMVMGAKIWLALMIYAGTGAAILLGAVFLVIAMSSRLHQKPENSSSKLSPASR